MKRLDFLRNVAASLGALAIGNKLEVIEKATEVFSPLPVVSVPGMRTFRISVPRNSFAMRDVIVSKTLNLQYYISHERNGMLVAKCIDVPDLEIEIVQDEDPLPAHKTPSYQRVCSALPEYNKNDNTT